MPAIFPATAPDERFVFLDAIRGMAAIFVLLRHAGALLDIPFQRSYLAVDLFFLLSGFVIAHAYDEKLRDGTLTARGFMALRLIRLYPVYLLALLLSLAMLFATLRGSAAFVVRDIAQAASLAALFLPAHMAGYMALFPINSPCWSLFFELVVNFAYALARPLLGNRVLVAVAGIAAAAASLLAWRSGSLDLGYNWQPVSIAGGLARAVFGIAAGVLIHRHRQRIFRNRLLPFPASPWLGVLLVAAVLCSPALPWANWLADLVCVFAVLPVAVICAASGRPATATLARILLAIGVASYPIYVLHRPAIDLIVLLTHEAPRPGPPLAGVSLVLLLFALSLQVDKHYDVPVRRWLRRRMR